MNRNITIRTYKPRKGYVHLTLSTLDILKPARHLYGKFGFHLVKSESFNKWDEARQMHQEIWECE